MLESPPPASWFWSHDIEPGQLDHICGPGSRLVRLSGYGPAQRRRFASLTHLESGAGAAQVVQGEPAELTAGPPPPDTAPVTVTVGTVGPRPRLVLALRPAPGPAPSVQLDVAEPEAVELVAGAGYGVTDLATYLVGGARRYALIVHPRTLPCWLLTGLTEGTLRRRLKELDATVVRLRSYTEQGERRLVAVAQPVRGRPALWYTDLSADQVARRLEQHHAYPIDLDADHDERGVRFTVVMRR